jgi:hypothetical protein
MSRSPHLLIESSGDFSPDAYDRGVRPKYAPTSRERGERLLGQLRDRRVVLFDALRHPFEHGKQRQHRRRELAGDQLANADVEALGGTARQRSLSREATRARS